VWIAQHCSLQNIEIRMPTRRRAKHRGIYMENGSGGKNHLLALVRLTGQVS
jgi:hypothetical protein